MKLPRKRSIGLLAFAALLMTVLISAQPRAALRTDSTGVSLARLVPSADSSIVVIYDPGACFKCDSLMPRLLEWARLHPGRFSVALTRRASADEQAQMALLGIQPAAVVQRDPISFLGGRHYRPELVLFVNGREVHSEPYDNALSKRRDLYVYLLEGHLSGDALRE